MAFSALEHRDSHAIGTGLSIGVHGLILGAILFAAFQSPADVTAPSVPIALLAPNLTRPGAPGTSGGSGMAPEQTRTPDAVKRDRPPTDAPAKITPSEVIPAIVVDVPKLLPGSSIDIETSGRGIGPGAGSERGSGFGGPGARSGPGRGDGFGGDGSGPGTGATSPQLLREVRPAYTVEAMRAKIQGRVELEVVVLADGTVDPKQIRIVRSLDTTFGLDAQAIEAVKQWRFQAGRQNGRAVPMRVGVELTFTLR